jgi:hypothetical protein
MDLSALLVVWTDELFWLKPADPHWNHIAPVEGLLAVHGLAGVTALLVGAAQMSSRIRRGSPALHRSLCKIYIAAVCISAPSRHLHWHQHAGARQHPLRADLPGRLLAIQRAGRLGLHPQRPDAAAQGMDDA